MSGSAGTAFPRWWAVTQGLALVGLGGLLVALAVVPEVALRTFWYGFIPVVPLVLMASPNLWRNVCPLATLNLTTGRRWGRRALTPALARRTGAAGILLLALLVPSRHLLWNSSGLALLALVAVLGVSALALGLVFDAKAGFCNSICPVLPVERLYGQRPWLEPGNPRCPSCDVCTRGGCLDLGPTKSVAQTLGPARKSTRWILTPFGAFALAFPGLIVGYFTFTLGSGTAPFLVFVHVGAWMATSYAVGSVAVGVSKLPAEIAVALAAAAAFILYYWLSAPTVVEELGLPPLTTAVIRSGALVVAGVWLWRAIPGRKT